MSRYLLTSFLTLLILTSLATSTIIHVPQDQPTIQAGIIAVSDGDTVLVSPGTYVENINFNGKNIVVGSLFLTTGDTSYISQTVIDGDSVGCVVTFEGGEDSTAVVFGFTITNGYGEEIGGGIYCDQSSPTLANLVINSNIGFFGGGVYCYYAHPTMKDIVIVNNSAAYGGGMYCYASSPRLNRVTIRENRADRRIASYGGGISSQSSSLVLRNVTVMNNYALLSGGGINCFGSEPEFHPTDRTNIYMNHAGVGADFYAYSTSANIVITVDTFTVMNPTNYHAYSSGNLTFDIWHAKIAQVEADLYVDPYGDDNNSGLSSAVPLRTISYALSKIMADESNPHTIFLTPGVYSPATNGEIYPLFGSSYVTLLGSNRDQTILDAQWESGVLICFQSNGFVAENITLQNGVAAMGGGFYCRYESYPRLVGVAISGNSALMGGGIFCGSISSMILTNVTMSNNYAAWTGGGIYLHRFSHASLVNCVIWDNLPQEVNFNHADVANSIMIGYSDIMGGEEGIVTNNNGSVYWEDGNIDTDPLFVDSENGNFNLQEDSPCIDAGTAFVVWEGDTLVDLGPEEYEGNAPDMGAFESPYTASVADQPQIPEKFALYQNYPNPFNPVTTIRFDLPEDADVQLAVYDVLGRVVEEMVSGQLVSGKHEVVWDASEVSSGVYLCQLTTNNLVITRKMVVVK